MSLIFVCAAFAIAVATLVRLMRLGGRVHATGSRSRLGDGLEHAVDAWLICDAIGDLTDGDGGDW